ncbi:sialate O-acetylesterase [Saccharicrinis aurantiacus]|uniref:sialate O-acetylesterase n=1 Tax=Saccharicrinis aurantiacus TaxID=1849719 RepID=UPI002492878D|nr:sialate O-acetylesterase [Saccharicrinis aurantiacus]
MKKFTLLTLIGILSISSCFIKAENISIEGTWHIKDMGIYSDLFSWETWGWEKTELLTNYLPNANAELDNTITFTTTGTNGDGNLYGTYENNAGIDGAYADFADATKSWDFNYRYRRVPTGTGTWIQVGNIVTITVGSTDFVLDIEAGESADFIALSTAVEYLSENFDWGEQDYSYEELAHMSKKMWYNLSKNQVIPDPEPNAPTNLNFSNITANGFTLEWENDANATGGTNVFIEKIGDGNGFTYVTTLAVDETSYIYEGDQNGVTVDGSGVYNVTIQSLPDADNSAYANATINMDDQSGQDIAFDPNFHIYLCIGQSNMEGSAPIESSDKVANSRFKIYQAMDCNNLNRTNNKWYDALPPLCQCYTQLSVADNFGKTMIASLDESISVGLVHVAVGGSDIRLFDKDLYQDHISADFQDKVDMYYGGNPYQKLIALATEAKKSGVIKGILLHQGESNYWAGDEVNWPGYVKTVYENILSDLSLDADMVPLLAGQVGHNDDGGDLGDMNATIDQLPSTIPTAHVISSKGCSIQDDNIHFDSAGARELGKRYADTMIDILNNAPTKIEQVEAGFTLNQNYPNPATNHTNITFSLSELANTTLKVFNVHGIEIATLVNQTLEAGKHSVNFNTSSLPAGVYFYTLKNGNTSASRRMIIAK